ncbi:MAG: cyclomaltodextrinase C-terminal domain-containing protein [Bacteroidota bacterium]
MACTLISVYDAGQTVMVIVNTGDKAAKPNWDSYAERTHGFTKIKDVITAGSFHLPDWNYNRKNRW